jgi:hypothetical protein
MEEAIALSNRSAANTLRTRRLDVPNALGGHAALVVAPLLARHLGANLSFYLAPTIGLLALVWLQHQDV